MEKTDIYVNPFDIINKENSDICYKESFLLFTVAVAGKTASVTGEKINSVLLEIMEGERGSVFDKIKEKYAKEDYQEFLNILKKHKTGKYNTLLNFIKDVNKSNIDLYDCSVEELENLSGIGKKSSRYYMLYNSNNKKQYAVLDTHILKFLKKFDIDVPKNTPTGKEYDRLENIYLDIYNKSSFEGTLQEFDYAIWETKGELKLNISDRQNKKE